MASLWEALGAPPWRQVLPTARDPSWVAAHRSLWLQLSATGVARRFRSPASLWLLLHGSSLRLGSTWGQLCQDHTLADVAGLAGAPICGSAPTSTTWNVRWLHNPHTATAAAKRAAILRRLQVGDILFLQETHWSDTSQAIWAGLFPAATVVSAPGRPGPTGGRQGGVAIIIPAGWSLVDSAIRVEGCCVEAVVRSPRDDTTYCLRSIYLPPDCQFEVLTAMQGVTPSAYPLIHGGDLNFQFFHPRNDAELEYQRLWLSYLQRHHSATVVAQACTRRRGDERAHLDDLAVPAAGAWTWEARLSWHHSLSDHAMIHYASTATPAATGRACTPAAVQRLPTAAWTDLRLRYLRLERQFGVISDPDGPHTATLGAAGRSDRDQQGIPHMPALLAYGRTSLSSTLTAWWRAWHHRTTHAQHPGALLAAWMRRTVAGIPEGEMLAWLRGVGWSGTLLSPEDAAAWLHVWQQEQALTRRRAVHPFLGGPQVHSTRRTEATSVGRQVFRNRMQGRGVRDTAGILHLDPRTTEPLLWADRADIWTRPPALPGNGATLLDSYFRHRGASSFPSTPVPNRMRLHEAVLARSDSAPGVDGEPYELYHPGANFVAHLLAQAHHAAALSSHALESVLGPNVDLLIWIPKKDNAEATSDWRPLQLPSCFRRLYGSAVVDVAAPIIEPRLSIHQSAIRGGTCGRNVSQVFAHLSRPDATPTEGDRRLWHAVLGPAATAADLLAQRSQSADIAQCPAIVFADQSKAFERISHAWLHDILVRCAALASAFFVGAHHRTDSPTVRQRQIRPGPHSRMQRGHGGHQQPFLLGPRL